MFFLAFWFCGFGFGDFGCLDLGFCIGRLILHNEMLAWVVGLIVCGIQNKQEKQKPNMAPNFSKRNSNGLFLKNIMEVTK